MNILMIPNSLLYDVVIPVISIRWYHYLIRLIKQIKKLIGFFRVSHPNNIIFNHKNLHKYIGKYVTIQGKTEKLYEREGNDLKPNIILSYANTPYIEDFFLCLDKSSKILVQPHLKTKTYNLDLGYIRNDDSLFSKIINFVFFHKSPVLEADQHIVMYGKITNNSLSSTNSINNSISIVPSWIDKSCQLSDKYFNRRSETLSKLKKTVSEFIVLSAILVLYISFSNIWLRIKFFMNKWKLRRRRRIYCKRCNINPCNILCEECNGLNEYCSDCFKSFQTEILDHNIQLKNIRCCYCRKELNTVQILMHS